MKFNSLAMIVALTLSAIASARGDTTPQTKASQATVVTAKDIQAAVKRNNMGAFSDSVLDVIPIESQYNVGVAVVRRTPKDGHAPPDALVHNDVTEVYQIIEGSGVLVTGGKLQSPKPLTKAAVVREIGPSFIGASIVGGTRHHVGPGDIVVIPPHTPHGFVEIDTTRIVYTIIRIDPKRVLALSSNPR